MTVMQGAKSVQIAVDGTPVAVLVRQEDAWRFVAVRFPVWDLDGATFTTPGAAVVAAAEVMRGGRSVPEPA